MKCFDLQYRATDGDLAFVFSTCRRLLLYIENILFSTAWINSINVNKLHGCQHTRFLVNIVFTLDVLCYYIIQHFSKTVLYIFVLHSK